MQTATDAFAGADRLSPRRRDGLPRRRRPSYRLLTVVPVLGLMAILVLATGTDPAALSILAVVATLFVGGWFVSAAVSASGGRTRYAALREEVGREGVAVRSTTWVDDGRPVAASERDDGRKPGRRHQLLSFTEAGIELRERPVGGRRGATLLPYAAIDHVEVGTATFSDWTERAVLIAGRIDGRPVELGVVPVVESSVLVSPVTDAAYGALLERIIACAESGRAPEELVDRATG